MTDEKNNESGNGEDDTTSKVNENNKKISELSIEEERFGEITLNSVDMLYEPFVTFSHDSIPLHVDIKNARFNPFINGNTIYISLGNLHKINIGNASLCVNFSPKLSTLVAWLYKYLNDEFITLINTTLVIHDESSQSEDDDSDDEFNLESIDLIYENLLLTIGELEKIRFFLEDFKNRNCHD